MKLSLEQLKAKSGQAYLDVNAVKGGAMDDCHIEPIKIEPIIIKTDNV